MPMELLDLEIEEVSSVERAANNRRFLIIKRAESVDKQEGVTVGDVYDNTYSTGHTCTDPGCDDPNCPVHGAIVRARRRKKRRLSKGPINEMGAHGEPDGDEEPPLDYASRAQQYDLWECIWQKWECFCSTFYDIVADSDEDNIPHLPILVSSIDQFGEDVAQLLEDCGITKAVRPHLDDLQALCSAPLAKAGAAMAGHRRKRLSDAIAALQSILDECSPEDLPHGIAPPIDHAGVSAAEVAGMPHYIKGAPAMAETLEGVTKRADAAEAQVQALTIQLETAQSHIKELEPLALQVQALETTLAKMRQTPEEQEAEYWASVPEPVRKKHEADEAEKVELRKQLQEAREEREQTVYISKTADYRGFGMTQRHWRILKAIEAIVDTEDRDELLRLMKAANERDSTSELYRAAGSEGRYGSNGTTHTLESASASDQLMALTSAYMSEHSVDFLKASEVIAKSHRELYSRAAQERRTASKVSSE